MAPSQSDIFFARSVVSSRADGRPWVGPGGMTFTVHHNPVVVGAPSDAPRSGRLVLTSCACDDSEYDRLRLVFAAIGYAVHRQGEAEAISAGCPPVPG